VFPDNANGIQEEGQTMKKKMKLNLDKDHLKAFFILHSEKIVCGLFVAFMAMLCWKAYGLEMYKSTPQDLASKTAQANELLATSKFDPVKAEVVVLDYPIAVNQRKGTIMPNRYHTIAWCPPVYLYKVRRGEPSFFPLEQLVADTGYGAIAYGGEGGEGGPANGKGLVRGIRPPPNAQIRGEYWAVIRGLVPVGDQEREYERMFSNAMHRDPKKDSPEYVDAGFEIQRYEGTATGPVNEKDWVTLDVSKIVEETLYKWAAYFPEIADPALVEASVCEPLPPLVGKNFDPATVTHLPQIGLAVKKEAATEEEKKAEPDPADEEEKPKVFGKKRGVAKAVPIEDQAKLTEERRMKKVVPYRLFRFFDFSVVPGKVYRYRVRLALHNPNFGIDPRFLQVPAKMGDPSVGDGEERKTAWSTASNPVTLPRNYEILAGSVYKPRSETKEVQGTLVIRQWDSTQAVDAVHEFNKEGVKLAPNETRPEIQRGTLLNIKTAVLVDKPGTVQPVTEEVTFRTDELVVDMSGAEFMPGPSGPGTSSAKKLRAPSEMLFLQPNGELVIRDLVSEAEDYARLAREMADLQARMKKEPPPKAGSILENPTKNAVNIFDLDPKKKK
jgi:hypothetical protein